MMWSRRRNRWRKTKMEEMRGHEVAVRGLYSRLMSTAMARETGLVMLLLVASQVSTRWRWWRRRGPRVRVLCGSSSFGWCCVLLAGASVRGAASGELVVASRSPPSLSVLASRRRVPARHDTRGRGDPGKTRRQLT